MPTLKSQVYEKLEEVMDPELYISITDLGLIYNVQIKKDIAIITMTLTTIGCPLFVTIEQEVKNKLQEVEGLKDSQIKLVFNPPWSMEMLSENARAILGI